MEDAAYEFSRFIAETEYDDLPSEAVSVMKKSVIDTLGNALGGSTANGIREIYEIVEAWGGRPESTIIGYGNKVPCPNAALVNSAMSHALDFDDTFMPGSLHPSSVVVPSAFAISELKTGVGGKKFIASSCVAIEVGCRIGSASKYRRVDIPGGGGMGGWDNTPIIGYFEAAALGKLLDLSREAIHNALGIAYMQAAGNTQCLRDGSLTKRMGPGFASRGGITAALMAQKGITGAKRIFECDEAGYYILYHESYDRDILLGNLGEEFVMTGISIKPYSSCKHTHAPIDAIIQLVRENDLEPEHLKKIAVRVSPQAKIVCEPEDLRKKPVTSVDAQFSIPWVVACALIRGKVGNTEFTEDAIRDPALLAVSAKVQTIIDESLTSSEEAEVIIETKESTLSCRVTHPWGTPENPMSYGDVSKKVIECASLSIRPVPEKTMETVIDMIKNLENVKDVGEIVRLLGYTY